MGATADWVAGRRQCRHHRLPAAVLPPAHLPPPTLAACCRATRRLCLACQTAARCAASSTCLATCSAGRSCGRRGSPKSCASRWATLRRQTAGRRRSTWTPAKCRWARGASRSLLLAAMFALGNTTRCDARWSATCRLPGLCVSVCSASPPTHPPSLPHPPLSLPPSCTCCCRLLPQVAADTNGAFTRFMGMEQAAPDAAGARSQRYAALVDDGILLKVVSQSVGCRECRLQSEGVDVQHTTMESIFSVYAAQPSAVSHCALFPTPPAYLRPLLPPAAAVRGQVAGGGAQVGGRLHSEGTEGHALGWQRMATPDLLPHDCQLRQLAPHCIHAARQGQGGTAVC